MKAAIRSLVAILVLTGVAATTQTSSAHAATNRVTVSRTSLLPVPICAPDDPNACGIGTH